MSDEDRSLLTDDEQQEVDRHLKRDPSADRQTVEDMVRRRRRGIETPKAQRERAKLRAELGGAEEFKAMMQRIRDNPPPARPEADAPLQGDDEAQPAPGAASRPSSEPPEPAKPTAADRSAKGKRTGKRKPRAKPEPPAIDTAALRAELDAMTTCSDEALALVARIEWPERHDGEPCPDNRLPMLADLTGWLQGEHWRSETAAILRYLAGALGDDGRPFDHPELLDVDEDGHLYLRFSVTAADIERGHTEPTETPHRIQQSWGGYAAALAVVIENGANVDHAALHDVWCQCRPPELRRRHPCGPLVAAWQQHAPVKVPYVQGKHALILTRQVAQVEDTAERFYLSRFGAAAHRQPATGQLLLGFEHPEMEGPTLPANVWTLYLDEAEKRGSGLPAALRIFLASVLHVPLHARRVESPTDPPVTLSDLTLRKFLSWIYSGRTRPGEFWPVLMAARDVLHSPAADVVYEFNGRLWSRPVLRLDWPGSYDRRLLDEVWPVSVHLPPGDGTGPLIVEDRLRYWWTRDAAAARALINLAYRWHVEGKRLMPAARSRGHWLTIRNPKAYDRITDRERELLCFPPGTGRSERRKRVADGAAALERLVKAGDAVSTDGRLLPPVRIPPESDAARP